MSSLNHALNRYWIPKRAEGNFGIFSYLESNTKIVYNIEKSEQFAGFSVYKIMKQLDKFKFDKGV